MASWTDEGWGGRRGVRFGGITAFAAGRGVWSGGSLSVGVNSAVSAFGSGRVHFVVHGLDRRAVRWGVFSGRNRRVVWFHKCRPRHVGNNFVFDSGSDRGVETFGPLNSTEKISRKLLNELLDPGDDFILNELGDAERKKDD